MPLYVGTMLYAFYFNFAGITIKRLPQDSNETLDICENVPHRLIGSGTTGRCILVGVGVVLLEEVRHGGWAFRCSSQAQLGSLFLLSVDTDVEHSGTSPAPCLPT